MRKAGCVIVTAALLFGSVVAPVGAAQAPQGLSSLSAVLYEPESGRVLYEKDADTRRPMASTTKLMTALTAVQCLDTAATVTIPEAAVLVEGSSMGLRGGDRLTVRDLLTGLLLSSGNDAANALALLSCGSLPAFAARMNANAAALGMSRSVFVTPSGLDEGEHGSTARDMARLGAAVLREPLLAELCGTKVATVHINGNTVTLKNHNRLLWLYDNAVGLKTGFTKKSGKCLVSAATYNGVTLVVATFNGGDYWNDHIRLYEYGFSRTAAVSLPLPELGYVAVSGGTTAQVAVTATPPQAVVLVDDEAAQVTYEWELPRFVWAPVQAGERVGTLRYRLGERILAEVPLTAGNAVSERVALSFVEKWRRQWIRLWGALMR